MGSSDATGPCGRVQVRARRKFLDGGHYRPVARAVAEAVAAAPAASHRTRRGSGGGGGSCGGSTAAEANILDAGCGAHPAPCTSAALSSVPIISAARRAEETPGHILLTVLAQHLALPVHSMYSCQCPYIRRSVLTSCRAFCSVVALSVETQRKRVVSHSRVCGEDDAA